MKLEDIDHTELIAKGIVCLRFKKSNDYTADLKQIPPFSRSHLIPNYI